jgi:hypothetical protein
VRDGPSSLARLAALPWAVDSVSKPSEHPAHTPTYSDPPPWPACETRPTPTRAIHQAHPHPLQTPPPPAPTRVPIHVVHGDVKVAHALPAVQVHGQHPVGPRLRDDVGAQLGGNGLASLRRAGCRGGGGLRGAAWRSGPAAEGCVVGTPRVYGPRCRACKLQHHTQARHPRCTACAAEAAAPHAPPPRGSSWRGCPPTCVLRSARA